MEFLKGISEKLTAFSSSGKEQVEYDDQDEKNICGFIKGRVDESKQNPSRITFENNVITNTAYLLGYDSVYFDSRTRQLRPHSAISGFPAKSRVHANLILPTVQNRLARLCKSSPKYDVRPNSNGQEDKDAARLTLKVINNVWDRERVNEKRISLHMWQQQAGHAWVKVCWDTMRGQQVPTDNGVEHEGDISVEVCSPLEVFVDPLAQSVEEASWIIQAKVRKLSYFRNHYGEKGKEVKQEGAWLSSIKNLIKINNMSSRTQGGGGEEEMKDAAIEIAYYERPSKRFPEGRQIVVANNVLLQYKSLPVGEVPFVKFDDVKVGGKFYSESVITHMRPLQDQYNRNLRRKSEYLNKGLNLKYLAAKGSGLTEESISDNTEVVQFNSVPNAPAPQPLTPPQMPSYVYTDGETLKNDLSEISGISEVSKGQMPSASIPAIGMQLLQESDETRIGIVTESNENSWSDVGRLIAKYAARYYVSKRYLKEAGQSDEYTVKEFTGEDLKNSFDVVVVRGSTLPNSKVLKRQEILNAYSQGILGDPADPNLRRKLLSYLEFGDIASVWEDQYVDDAQIKNSIELIEQGIVAQIHPDDNHEAHFEYKNRLRKTERFEQYPEQIKTLFLENLETHKMFIAQNQMQAMGGMMPPAEQMPAEAGVAPEETMMVDETQLGEGL